MTGETKFDRRRGTSSRGVCRRCDAPSTVRVDIRATGVGKPSRYLGSRGGAFCDDHATEGVGRARSGGDAVMVARLFGPAGLFVIGFGLFADHPALLVVGFLAMLFAAGVHALPRQTDPPCVERPTDLIDVSGVDFQWPDRGAA